MKKSNLCTVMLLLSSVRESEKNLVPKQENSKGKF